MENVTETQPPIDHAEQLYSDFVAEYQDALESGRPLPDPSRLPASFASRWRRTRNLLHGLDRFTGNTGAADSSERGTPRTCDDTPLESTVTGMPTRFGRYEPGEELGRGGMGIVREAFDPFLGRTVALKIIRPERVADAGGRLRFEREAKFLAKLDHPHIVRVYEAGLEGEWPYLAMELVSGPSLHRMIDGKPLPAKRAAEIAAFLADGVAHAHALGVLHRDLKPGNVLLRGGMEPCITDFGLAAPLENAFGLTATDELVGTPNYLAPEMVLRPRDGASTAVDVYGLGAILYECLTGRPPFTGQALHAILWQVVNVDPVSPRLLVPDVPADLETICLKCLEKDPKRRYSDAKALADDLRRFSNGEAIAARPLGRAQRTARWARRHPGLAASWTLTYMVGLALLATALAYNLKLGKERDRAKGNEAIAIEARKLSEQRSIDLAVTLANQAGDPQTAALWYAQAAKQAEAAEMPVEHLVRHWRGQAAAGLRPWAAFRVPSDCKQLRMHASGRWLAARGKQEWSLWDAASGQRMPIPDGFSPASLCWNREGTLLALGDAAGRTEVRAFPELRREQAWKFDGPTKHLAFDADGAKLGIVNDQARIFDLKAGRFIPAGPLPVEKPATLRFHPTAASAMIGTTGKEMIGVQLDGDEPGKAFVGPLPGFGLPSDAGEDDVPGFLATDRFFTEGPGRVDMRMRNGTSAGTSWLSDPEHRTGVTLSPDGSRFVIRHPNRPVAMWHAIRGPFSPQRIGVVAGKVAFGADSQAIALAVRNGLELWRADGTPCDAAGGMGGEPDAVACSSGIRWAASVKDGLVRVWRNRPDEIGNSDLMPMRAATGLPVMAPDWESYISAGETPFLLRRYDARTGQPLGVEWKIAGQPVDAEFAPDGSIAYIALERQGKGVLSVQALGKAPKAFDEAPLSFEPIGLAVSPDGGKVAVLCRNSGVELIDAKDGTVRGAVKLQKKPFDRLGPAKRVRFSPDGSHFAVYGIGPFVAILDAQKCGLVHMLKLDNNCLGIDFSPDGATLVSLDGPSVRLWDWRKGERLPTELKHPNAVTAAHFSPKGNILLTACRDGGVRLWNAAEGFTLVKLLPHQREATAACFSRDGKRIAVVQAGQRVRVWEADSGLQAFPDWPLLGEDDPIPPHPGWVAFAADGKRLLAGVRFLRLWHFDLEAAEAVPPPGGIAEMLRLAELESGIVIGSAGILEAIPQDDWMKRWEEFRLRYPDYHRWPRR